MQTPGTAAINLPAFTALAFTQAKVPLGAKVTDFTVESTSDVAQINVPFTFGQPFAQGDLLFGDGLAATGVQALQVDAKATWPDGSLRHAVISGVLPALAPRAIAKFDLKRSARPVLAAGGKLAAFDARVEIVAGGKTYTASLNDIPAELNLNGAVMRELIGLVPLRAEDGTAHPDLMVAMQERGYFGSASARWRVTVEHTRAYSRTGELTYDARIVVAGVTVFEQKALLHYPNARWSKVIWLGTAPNINIRHNAEYLRGTRQVPNINADVKLSESYLKSMGSSVYAPMTLSRLYPYMPTTGAHPELGIMPDAYAATVLSADPRAKNAMLVMADSAGTYLMHRRDMITGRPMNLINWPYASIEGRDTDTGNPYTGQREYIYGQAASVNQTMVVDSSHQPALAYVPYLLTGDFYYLEELHFWTNLNLYKSNPGYRATVRGLLNNDQVRGQAWSMRTLGECAAITPDGHPDKAAFNYWLDENLNWYNATYTCNSSANKLGVLTNGYAIAYGDTGIAPWQDDFFTQAIGHLVDLGFSKALPLFKWKSKFVVDRMTAPGTCWIGASRYSMSIRPTGASPFYETYEQVYRANNTQGVLDAACGGAEMAKLMGVQEDESLKVGQMLGYADGGMGYPSNMQPALAYAVDYGDERAAQGWATFQARAVQPNYENGPQFAIIPRKIAATQPLPGNAMTFKITVAGFDSAVQNLPAGSDAALSSIRIEILSPDSATVLGKSDTLPYSLGGLQAGVYPIRLSAIDSKGAVMGTPATATADTASAPALPPALVSVSLPSAISFSVAQEQ